jgi:tetratricopeptide (TPR) repeat protein
VLTHA